MEPLYTNMDSPNDRSSPNAGRILDDVLDIIFGNTNRIFFFSFGSEQ